MTDKLKDIHKLLVQALKAEHKPELRAKLLDALEQVEEEEEEAGQEVSEPTAAELEEGEGDNETEEEEDSDAEEPPAETPPPVESVEGPTKETAEEEGKTPEQPVAVEIAAQKETAVMVAKPAKKRKWGRK